MKVERDSRTTELTLGNLLACNGEKARFPGDGKSWPVPGIPGRIDGALELAAVHYTGVASMVAAVNGEYGRIRVLQDRLDEADRLLSAIHRTSNLRSRGYAKLVVNYANALHRLHRDDEAIAALDRIEPVLRKYPDTLDGQAAVAAKLRKAIVADS